MTALFIVSNNRIGGWYTYTAHLAKALGEAVVFRVGEHTEAKLRPFADEIMYQNISVRAAVALTEMQGGVVTCAEPKKWVTACDLLYAGAALVVHDPKEMTDVRIPAMRVTRRVIAVREGNVAALAERGVKATFVRHPYQAARPEHIGDRLAAAVTRIDVQKHPGIVIEANAFLSEPIDLWGDENRVWCHHYLDRQHPNWRTYYRAKWASDDLRAATEILRCYRYAIDLSVLKGDGSGTQYAHLEAWDAGCRLITHADWHDASGASVAVADAVQLANLLTSPRSWETEQARAREMLVRHDAALVGPEFMEAIA